MAVDNGATHSSFKLNVNSDTKTTGFTGDKGTYVENFPFIPFQLKNLKNLSHERDFNPIQGGPFGRF